MEATIIKTEEEVQNIQDLLKTAKTKKTKRENIRLLLSQMR